MYDVISPEVASLVSLVLLGLLLVGMLMVVGWFLPRQRRAVSAQTETLARELAELRGELRSIAVSQDSSHASAQSTVNARLDRIDARLGQAGLSLTELSSMKPLVDRMDLRLGQVALLQREVGAVRQEVSSGLAGLAEGDNGLRALREGVDALRDEVHKSSVEVVDLLRPQLDWRIDTTRRLQRLTRDTTNEVQALLQLRDLYPTALPLPALGGWALQGQSMVRILQSVAGMAETPLMVECGSGASTIWVGALLRSRGAGRLISLEHDEHFYDESRRMVADHGLEEFVDVRLAPLQPLSLDGRDYQWYAVEALHDVDGINIVLVDGPPQATGKEARYPAIPVLMDKLADRAEIFVDDADRPDESVTIDRWLSNPSLRRPVQSATRMAHIVHDRSAV